MVLDGDLGENLRRRRLRVRDIDRPISSMIENAGVHELVLRIVTGTSGVFIDQLLVGKRGLRIVVTPAQPSVAGQPIEVPPVLFDVLAVVPLRTGETKHAFLEDRVDAVPERQSQAQLVATVRQACHAILIPPVGPGPCMIMRKETPGITAVAVVLPHSAPGPLRQVRTPLVPRIGFGEVVCPSSRLSKPVVLSGGT
jgi:hypothetical protein